MATLEWYETKLDDAAAVAVDIGAGKATPGDLHRVLARVHTAAEADGRWRTAEAVQEALTQLSGGRTVQGFATYALNTDWFGRVKRSAVHELS